MRSRTHSQIPTIERLGEDDEAFKIDAKWIPYPQPEPLIDVDFGRLANLHYDLHELGAKIANILSDTNDQQHFQSRTLEELNEMFATLMPTLPQSREDKVLNPHIMDVKYVIILMFDPYTKALQSCLPLATDEIF